MDSVKIAVVGLGYVGLPLAVAFGRKFPTIGFDLSRAKIAAYRQGIDPSEEIGPTELKAAVHLTYTNEAADLGQADVIIVAVPTPVDAAHNPDFNALITSSETVGKHMKRGAIVVYEFDGLSRRNGRDLHPCAGAGVGLQVEGRLFRRLFARAHQSRR